jgi:hypothetical protein
VAPQTRPVAGLQQAEAGTAQSMTALAHMFAVGVPVGVLVLGTWTLRPRTRVRPPEMPTAADDAGGPAEAPPRS